MYHPMKILEGKGQQIQDESMPIWDPQDEP
jgi:hypothetical protein